MPARNAKAKSAKPVKATKAQFLNSRISHDLSSNVTKSDETTRVPIDADDMRPTDPAKIRVWQAAFITALGTNGNVTDSARAAGVDRPHAYAVRDKDPVFAAQWKDALYRASDVLEAEARRRAVEGFEEPVYQGGVRVGAIRRYSDNLLITLLKAAKPEKYRERHSVEVDVSKLSDEQLKQIVEGKDVSGVATN